MYYLSLPLRLFGLTVKTQTYICLFDRSAIEHHWYLNTIFSEYERVVCFSIFLNANQMYQHIIYTD